MKFRFDPYQVPRFLSSICLPLSWTYGGGMACRYLFYRLGLLRTRRLKHPVISVGNLTVGGTGKTPVAACLARWLQGKGWKPAILSRGYGARLTSGVSEADVRVVSDGSTVLLAAEQAGDEPFLLAKTLPGVPVLCCSSRYRAGVFAQEHFPVNVFILDDGFQHLGLHRDLNLLVADARSPLGNSRVLPSGPCREFPRFVKRSDAILLTRFKEQEEDPTDRQSFLSRFGQIPVHTAAFRLGTILSADGMKTFNPSDIQGAKAVAFCGLAIPEQFFKMVSSAGVTLAGQIAFPDHYHYHPKDINALERARLSAGADFLITTEKDLVRIPVDRESPVIYAWALEVQLLGTFLQDQLERTLSRWGKQIKCG